MTPPVETPQDATRFLALAPMDGITDATWRALATDLDDAPSGISLCVSEFVRVTAHAVPAAVLQREVPELARGGRTPRGVPVAVQLLGGAPEPMAATAARLAELGALAIDLNFGCPAKTVNNHDGGAALLRAPCRIEAVVDAVRKAVPMHVPVSAKIRLGWDSADGVESLARAAEAGGASWLTIHARTRAQLYAPPVDWVAIGRARAAVTMPVVANGDLCTTADLEACAHASGCNAFMIGRGAMADPWLFRRARGDADPAGFDAGVDGVRLRALIDRYVVALLAAGTREGTALGRVKQWLRFAATNHAPGARAFERIKRCASLAEAAAVLDDELTDVRAAPVSRCSPARPAAGLRPAASTWSRTPSPA